MPPITMYEVICMLLVLRLEKRGWKLFSAQQGIYFKNGWFCRVDVHPDFWKSTVFYKERRHLDVKT